MPSREEVEFILVADLERATRSFRKAAAEFQALIAEVPSGIPSPDGSLRLREAGERKRSALNALNAALQRHSAFVLDGRIPVDLAEEASGQGA